MFGVQWDLMLKYLITSEAATSAVINSTSWGNSVRTLWNITSNEAKYSDDHTDGRHLVRYAT